MIDVGLGWMPEIPLAIKLLIAYGIVLSAVGLVIFLCVVPRDR
jgi:hypothetical protein